MKLKFLTSAPQQTKKAGEILAKEILNTTPCKKALVLGLVGDLGGGKTTFIQGLAEGLGIRERVLSPTFVLIKKFLISNYQLQPSRRSSWGSANFYHIDCYRIQKSKELLDLGFREIIANPRNVVAVEWADKIRKIMPRGTIWISFEFIDNKTRKIVLE
jgi:tRNA threonylcarbamoyladenosine biosynthesis protein TsaE